MKVLTRNKMKNKYYNVRNSWKACVSHEQFTKT